MPASIDLRSDTVTLPTESMRAATYVASLGDDVYSEDPTVNRLEEMAAEMVGKEVAIYCASGTMSNLVALMSHCQRGDEVIVGDEAHIYHHEGGGYGALAGLLLRPVPNRSGMPPVEDIEAAIRPPSVYGPPTGLIALENTHNRCGGTVVTPSEMEAIGQIARKHHLPTHLDGARIFNAAVALGVEARELARHADSVAFCVSKGLAAPVGSLLCGSKEFVARARRFRRMLGGGMRQAGVIAAAGIVALQEMIPRLAEDHANARYFAERLAALPGVAVDPGTARTNIVAFRFVSSAISPDEFRARLAQRGLRISTFGGNRMRAVTHYGVSRQDVETAADIVESVLLELEAGLAAGTRPRR